MSVPLVDPEVFVPSIGDRVPGNVLPSHPLLQALDLKLGRARGERQGRVPRVQVGGVRDLVGDERAADTADLRVSAFGPLGVGGDPRLVEGAVDDELAAALEQVEQAYLAIGPVELIRLLNCHPGHPSTLGGQCVTGAGQLLLFQEELLPCSLPLSFRYDPRSLHSCHIVSPMASPLVSNLRRLPYSSYIMPARRPSSRAGK